MDTVKVIEVIQTSLQRRGSGKDEHSPVRVIMQYWTPGGELLAEVDPAGFTLSPERVHELDQLLGATVKSRPLTALLLPEDATREGRTVQAPLPG